MPRKILLLLTAALTLTSCARSGPSGAVRVPPPDSTLTTPCPQPEAVIAGTRDWQVIAARLGVALIRCGQQKDALSAWAGELSATLAD